MKEIKDLDVSKALLENQHHLNYQILRLSSEAKKFKGKPYQIYQIFMKGVYLNKCQITLKICFQNFNVALNKVSVHSIT